VIQDEMAFGIREKSCNVVAGGGLPARPGEEARRFTKRSCVQALGSAAGPRAHRGAVARLLCGLGPAVCGHPASGPALHVGGRGNRLRQGAGDGGLQKGSWC
jgi:hypothetical protein